MASDQTPGAEFLLRRLAHAQAVPRAERPPEVAAFVESVQLMRDVCDRLPLTAEVDAVLQLSSPDAQQQVLLALLKAARASHLCRPTPVCDRTFLPHLSAYLTAKRPLIYVLASRSGSRRHSAGTSHVDSEEGSSGTSPAAAATSVQEVSELEKALLMQAATTFQTGTQSALAAAASRMGMLETPAFRQAASQQLAQLAAAHPGQAFPSVEQLGCKCCHSALATVGMETDGSVRRESASDLTDNELHRFQQVTLPKCISLLKQVESRSPWTWHAAGELAKLQQESDRASALFLQGAKLAEEQGAHLAFAHLAIGALHMAIKDATRGRPVGSATFLAVLAAFRRAEPALQRVRRLLPAAWVETAAMNIDSMNTVLPQGSVSVAAARSHAATLQQARAMLGHGKSEQTSAMGAAGRRWAFAAARAASTLQV